jgi:hypothetical protein
VYQARLPPPLKQRIGGTSASPTAAQAIGEDLAAFQGGAVAAYQLVSGQASEGFTSLVTPRAMPAAAAEAPMLPRIGGLAPASEAYQQAFAPPGWDAGLLGWDPLGDAEGEEH